MTSSIITPEEYERLTGKPLPQQMCEYLEEQQQKKQTQPGEPRYLIVLEGFQDGGGLVRLEATCTEAGRVRVRTYLARINERNGWHAAIYERRVI